ncbi:hypothetical protein RSOL_558160 [Rhizoctonia solani AG-3 Rhs1AP]|uniref:Uncharacterized protein n=2 Tax=Rhizoctonia solani AG-3 TaxID=1086053 RepID=A0A074RFN2_9AGAM|nr:hypothetical protein RSOL_558160 [Rhizoctonia solani AG-3 Rhs1AP]KEP45936.1 hypothetical protein V565_229400 [Rhizoctonia solani 123E]
MPSSQSLTFQNAPICVLGDPFVVIWNLHASVLSTTKVNSNQNDWCRVSLSFHCFRGMPPDYPHSGRSLLVLSVLSHLRSFWPIQRAQIDYLYPLLSGRGWKSRLDPCGGVASDSVRIRRGAASVGNPSHHIIGGYAGQGWRE